MKDLFQMSPWAVRNTDIFNCNLTYNRPIHADLNVCKNRWIKSYLMSINCVGKGKNEHRKWEDALGENTGFYSKIHLVQQLIWLPFDNNIAFYFFQLKQLYRKIVHMSWHKSKYNISWPSWWIILLYYFTLVNFLIVLLIRTHRCQYFPCDFTNLSQEFKHKTK